MRKFENVDIINSLRRIMNINTEHYKNDFFLDVDTIHTAALSDSAEDKYLLFMSRLNGTYCYCETTSLQKIHQHIILGHTMANRHTTILLPMLLK